MSKLEKTDSDVSDLSQSSTSPSRSPRRADYFVQSPSRDSNDAERTTNSSNSSPLQSPLGSPPWSQCSSSLSPRSRESSSSRYYRFGRTSSLNNSRKGGWRPWKDQFYFEPIQEEDSPDDHDGSQRGISRCCHFLLFVVGFMILFSIFCLILSSASRPMKPTITMKSIMFDQFVIQAGADSSGVATSMVSMNSFVNLTFRNTATFFGVHVTSTALDLTYYQITLATGSIDKFEQSRKSERSIKVRTRGKHVPLYGGGSSLNSLKGEAVTPVPLNLRVVVQSKAYVLGKLVRRNFIDTVECSLFMDPKKMNVPISLKNNCTYQ